MHEVVQDIMVMYTLVKNFFLMFLRVIRVYEGVESFWGFLKVFGVLWFWGLFYGFLSYVPIILLIFTF